jgi:hypothetical protein
MNNKICIIIGCFKNHKVVNNIYNFIHNITNNFDFYVVNNNIKIHKQIINEYSDKFIVIEGDNSSYEFSGIQKCLDIIDKNKYSLFLLGTDALFNHPIEYLDFINLDMIEYSMNNECYIGNIDSFFKNYVIDDFTVNYWIRTSFIFINSNLFKKINYQFITYNYKDIFDKEENIKIKIDQELLNFLKNWLKKDRYKYINNINIKINCIINEWKLTNKLIKHGKIFDYTNIYLLYFHESIITKNNKMILLNNHNYVQYPIITKIEAHNWMEQLKLKNNLLK